MKKQTMLGRWKRDIELLSANDKKYTEKADREGGLETPDKLAAGAVMRELRKIQGLAEARAKAIIRMYGKHQNLKDLGVSGTEYDDACMFMDLIDEYTSEGPSKEWAKSSLENIFKFPIDELELAQQMTQEMIS